MKVLSLFDSDDNYGFPNTNQVADHLIANGETVQEWISVKDRLPEDYKQRVLVICIGDYPIGYPKIDTDRYVRGHWVRYGIYVTHWMPLPKLPKG